MWNLKIIQTKDILTQYNLLSDPLIGKTVILKDEKYIIKNIFKEWNCGWFLSMEIEKNPMDKNYYKIPFKNINSENSEILERINIIQNQIKIQD